MASITVFIMLLMSFYSLMHPVASNKEEGIVNSASIVKQNLSTNVTDKVIVDVYFETMCPDSKTFIVKQVYPAYKAIKEIMKVNLIPFGKASYVRNSDGSVSFSCQHGPNECQGNKIESCVLHLIPDEDKQMSFVDCMAAVPRPYASARSCAAKSNIDYNKISTCINSEQGNNFLIEEGDKTNALNPKLHFVPWVVVNNKYNEENRQASYENLIKLVCDMYKGPKIAACNSAK